MNRVSRKNNQIFICIVFSLKSIHRVIYMCFKMELSELDKLYIINNIAEDKDEIINKKHLILNKFEEHRKKPNTFIPKIYHINDTLADLEKRYTYYILKDTELMNPEDHMLDFMLMGILLFENSTIKNDMGINLDGFTETIILNKKEYKGLIKQICEMYLAPDNSNNVLLKLGMKLMMQGFNYAT